MEFDCTKEGKNIYFACREKAAKYNDLLNSRERAAELLGISTSTLANHELGVTKNVPPDTVVMMTYAQRGYAAIGGEWAIIPIVFLIEWFIKARRREARRKCRNTRA